HYEFLKFLDLPTRTEQPFELALSSYEPEDRDMLEEHGWRVRHALDLSTDLDPYRDYIAASRGEFTVAKDQNVRLRTGWFSDRSATYLAAGRPVITQDTGFGNVLPTGEGLFAFTSLDDIQAAVEAIDADYPRHSQAARAIAREYFEAEVVLARLLEQVGMPRIPPGLVIAPTSRRPLTLDPATVEAVLHAPLPVSMAKPNVQPEVSVVVVTHGDLVYNRLGLESLLASQGAPAFEVVVVDNASGNGTLDYLALLQQRDSRVRLIANEHNAGFAAAVNQGLSTATGRILVILNNDTIVPPRSLGRLVAHVSEPSLGLVGPISNEAATEAEIDVDYRT